MRQTTTRKTKRSLLARKPRTTLSFKALRTRVKRIHPFALVKRNPFPSFGIAVGLSALSGLAVWMFNRR